MHAYPADRRKLNQAKVCLRDPRGEKGGEKIDASVEQRGKLYKE